MILTKKTVFYGLFSFQGEYMARQSRPFFVGNGRLTEKEPLFYTPNQAGEAFVIPIKEYIEKYVKWERVTTLGVYWEVGWNITNFIGIVLTVTNEETGQIVIEEELIGGTSYNEPQGTQSVECSFSEGSYKIEYALRCRTEDTTVTYEATVSYYVSFVENRLPPKKWTVTDVIVRCCDLFEPLKMNDLPRFRFKGVNYDESGNVTGYEAGSKAEKFDKILAPEFAFTKMTAREVLKQIGGFIHGEPRITDIKTDTNNDKNSYFEFDFDMFGGIQKSKLKDFKPYITQTAKTDVNEYCTSLDSSVDNLVNRLDWAQGVITEPFYDYARTPRTENTTARLSEDNMFFQTVYPIDQVKKVLIKGFTANGQAVTTDLDITPYLFENADYSLLSSFSGTYPYSKSYAIKYTQGEKNITGLFFKPPSAIGGGALTNYAITNIINAVNGTNYGTSVIDYTTIQVQITYIPIYGTRITTAKPLIQGGLPRALAYNQGANLIETRYYGENLKGVAMRLGNVEQAFTYQLAFVSDIPKIGMLYDDNYYISAVSVEYLPTYIKCTVGLSKDFNRLSEYVGISSNLRMWEVSEKQAIERESVLTEYIVITTNSTVTSDDDTSNSFRPVYALFNTANSNVTYPITCANIATKLKNETTKSNVVLPVISSAMGNSMSFTFNFADNYSAGQKLINATDSSNQITGKWGDNVPYCDYYGRFYFMSIAFYSGTVVGVSPDNLPQGAIGGTVSCSIENWKYRKDNREVPQITYEIEAVTDDETIIIGSGLMANCGLVTVRPRAIKLYGFTEPLNVIDRIVDLTNATEITDAVTYGADTITLPNVGEYVAWAFVTEQTETTENVVDENGEETTQTIYEGGELILGQNQGLTGQTLYFREKRSIYDKT